MQKVGIDTCYYGICPYHAIKKVFKENQSNAEKMDSIELNKLLLSQSVAVARDLNLTMANVKCKRRGYWLLRFNPIGASGSRIVSKSHPWAF